MAGGDPRHQRVSVPGADGEFDAPEPLGTCAGTCPAPPPGAGSWPSNCRRGERSSEPLGEALEPRWRDCLRAGARRALQGLERIEDPCLSELRGEPGPRRRHDLGGRRWRTAIRAAGSWARRRYAGSFRREPRLGHDLEHQRPDRARRHTVRMRIGQRLQSHHRAHHRGVALGEAVVPNHRRPHQHQGQEHHPAATAVAPILLPPCTR